MVYAKNKVTWRTVPIDLNIAAIAEDVKVRGHIYLLSYEEGSLIASPLKGDQGVFAYNRAREGLSTEGLIGVSHFRTCPNADRFHKGKGQ